MPTTTDAYVTVPDTARILGVPEKRVRSWQDQGVIQPAARRGRIQYRGADVLRGAILLELQSIFGTDSRLAVELARAADPTSVDAGYVTIAHAGRTFTVDLPRERMRAVLEQLEAIP